MRMWPVLLIILGAAFISFGVYNLMPPKSNNQESSEPIKADTNNIDALVNMAVADGVLTEKEKAQIRAVAGTQADSAIDLAQAKIKEGTIEPETALRNTLKEKGDNFEAYVLGRFSAKFFTLNSWAGDKYAQGRFDEKTQQPDLQFTLNLQDTAVPLAVECKYRSSFNNGWVQVAKQEQLERYKAFSKKDNIPTYMALGVGGTAGAPCQILHYPYVQIRLGK